MRYIIVDSANLYFRARHIASRNANAWEKVGMALHLSLASINQVARKFGADHIVIALEGRSWRKDFYKPYKANRAIDETAMTEAEIEENKLFWETYEAFTTFLREKTNVSVIRHPQAEADDIIARFIHLHPNDEHFIISSDTDFIQLITENVKQYNGITNQLITVDGYFDDRDRPVIDKKTKQHKTLGDPQFILFEKCIRGDSTDNVFSAYPGVRTKGSKNKVGLTEAYADRDRQGFNWNNLLLQKWTDHNGTEHRVKDDYERNRILIDLTAQPEEIKQGVDDVIRHTVKLDQVPQVGVQLMKFAGKYELNKISEQAETYAKWLNNPYKGVLYEQAAV
jgi:5'-3' exonuclease